VLEIIQQFRAIFSEAEEGVNEYSFFHLRNFIIFAQPMYNNKLMPSLEKNSLVTALWMGALFGLIGYSTYDLTNLATI
jgi:uncharacterized membrane protein